MRVIPVCICEALSDDVVAHFARIDGDFVAVSFPGGTDIQASTT